MRDALVQDVGEHRRLAELGHRLGRQLLARVLASPTSDRPNSLLPETSVELPFVTVKLLAIGALMHAGWTLILWAAQRGVGRPEPSAPVIPSAKEIAASVKRSD